MATFVLPDLSVNNSTCRHYRVGLLPHKPFPLINVVQTYFVVSLSEVIQLVRGYVSSRLSSILPQSLHLPAYPPILPQSLHRLLRIPPGLVPSVYGSSILLTKWLSSLFVTCPYQYNRLSTTPPIFWIASFRIPFPPALPTLLHPVSCAFFTGQVSFPYIVAVFTADLKPSLL